LIAICTYQLTTKTITYKMEQSKEKVLVSGGAGFIGSHLVERLLLNGHEVVVIDNFSSGKKSNLPKGITMYELNVWHDYKKLYKVIEKEKPGIAFHLAAHKDVRASVDSPVLDAHTNIIGTLNVLEGMHRAGGGRVVFTSSIAVCSPNAKLPLNETCAIKPNAPYGVSKRAAELYMWHYSELRNMACISLRPTNIYGPRQTMEGASVIALFIQALMNGETPQIFGSGEHTRDFLYVDDVVDALMRSMRVGWCGELVLATGKETSVNQLYSMIKNELKVPTEADYTDAREGDLFQNYGDPSLALEVIGWTPKTSLEEGLKKTIEWYRGQSQK
jgi:UDP-glucose 4-epimerase